MRLIALETATDVCSVALLDDDFDAEQPVAALTLARPRAHAENLVPLLQDALRYAGFPAASLDAVAVSQGPGSYTGLRIGASTAKGLAAALDLQLVAVPSLEALAAAVAPLAEPGDRICAAFNARRTEVYAAAFEVDAAGRLQPLRETAALDADSLPEWLEATREHRYWLVGEGAAQAAAALQAGGFRWKRPGPAFDVPSAAWIARLGRLRLAEGRTEDIAAFEPFYLKEFVAKKPKGSVFERLPF